MSRFTLEGRLKVANALVGSFRNEELQLDQTVIIALLPEGTPPKEEKALKQEILTHSPNNYVPWIPQQQPELSGTFNRLSQQQLSFTIKAPGPAGEMIDVALGQGKTKNVIYCTSTAAYLSACSKFGISRQEMGSIAELNTEILPATKKTFSSDGPVGQAHKLCEMLTGLKAGHFFGDGEPETLGPFMMDTGPLAKRILQSTKFKGGTFSKQEAQERFSAVMEGIEEGQKKIYLPYRNCLFELDVDGRKIFLLAENHHGPWKPHDYTLTKEDFYMLPFIIEKGSDVCNFLPYAIVCKIENGILKRADTYSTGGDDAERNRRGTAFMSKHIDDGTISTFVSYAVTMLSIFNSPSHTPEIMQPPEAMTKARARKADGRPPFFDYYNIEVPDASAREEDLSTTRKIRAHSEAEGGHSGIRQRWHMRAGYYRDVVREGGVRETIFIGDYEAGDMKLGIVQKSKERRAPGIPADPYPQ